MGPEANHRQSRADRLTTRAGSAPRPWNKADRRLFYAPSEDEGAGMTLGPMPPTKSVLSPARQRLVELMQEINYGRIKALQIRAGEPVLSSSVCIEEEIVFGKDNTSNVSWAKSDFALKKEVVELFQLFDRKQQFSIERLEIQDGLPRRMTVGRRLMAV